MISISVIVPVFNGENYVNSFFQNFENQTFKDYEIILINDGSTDNSVKKIKKLNISKLRIFSFKKNKGVSAARNYGIKKAIGEFVYFIDIDDRIEKDSLEILFKNAKKFKCQYVCSDFKRIENFTNQRVNKYNYTKDIFFDKKNIKKAMREELHNPNLGHLGFFGCNGRLIKRSLLKKNDIKFCERLHWSEDKTFSWQVLGFVSRAKYIRQKLYSYYVYPNLKTGLSTGIILGDPLTNIKTIMNKVKKSLLQQNFKKKDIDILYQQGFIFYSIQFLVSISRSILLKKLNIYKGRKIRNNFIRKIFKMKFIEKSIKSYSISKYESKLIPKFIILKSIKELEIACDQRAEQVLRNRRKGRS